MADLRILLIGNGGREHALAWKLSQSPRVQKIYCVPGNGGTASCPKVKNVASVEPDDFPSLAKFSEYNKINLVVPGPEAPLVDGIERWFRNIGIPCFGPSQEAARLEGSKTYSKDFMKKYNVPTAAYENFSDYGKAVAYIDNVSHDVVIKATGLAAGKGVILPQTKDEAKAALRQIMVDKEFGDAGTEVVIEELLIGDELSVLTFCDGYTIRSLPLAQDHKRIFDGDEGPNTGGMGCYAPTNIATKELTEQIDRDILEPTISGMRREKQPFRGVLFTGLMITKDGPKVLEYNVRFGDPETQTVLPLLSADTDLAEIMLACANGYLDNCKLTVENKYSATVVLASGGYPGPYSKNKPIIVQEPPAGCTVFHAGTKIDGTEFKSSGGRVIAINAVGDTLRAAVDTAYAALDSKVIAFDGMFYRKDIAHRAFRDTDMDKPDETAMTYAGAGVDIQAGNDFVEKIKKAVASTKRAGADAEIGGFGGEVDLSQCGYPGAPIIVGAIDGVGTKLMIAQVMKRHDTVGIDLVAMNVNDLVVQGATPLMFLDYYGCSKLDLSQAADFVQGVADGCRQAGCALVGGETAEMPGMYQEDDYDAAGCAVGTVTSEAKLPRKEAMVAGDVLLGLGSAGVHSNGFSLVRRIVQSAGLAYTAAAPWDQSKTIGESLLTPTRIYVKSLLPVLEHVKGLAHITGGGLIENVPRMIPDSLAAEIEYGSWEIPPVFKWLKVAGNVAPVEMCRTFNSGIGMVIAVEASKAEAVAQALSTSETVYKIGRLVDRGQGEEGCVIRNIESWTGESSLALVLERDGIRGFGDFKDVMGELMLSLLESQPKSGARCGAANLSKAPKPEAREKHTVRHIAIGEAALSNLSQNYPSPAVATSGPHSLQRGGAAPPPQHTPFHSISDPAAQIFFIDSFQNFTTQINLPGPDSPPHQLCSLCISIGFPHTYDILSRSSLLVPFFDERPASSPVEPPSPSITRRVPSPRADRIPNLLFTTISRLSLRRPTEFFDANAPASISSSPQSPDFSHVATKTSPIANARTPHMTSPANQQNPIPATNTTATTATSYASAAGAPKKPAQAPIAAIGSHAPVVVGAPSSTAQNAKGASSSPVNGKQAVTPAVPAVSRVSANINGSASDHARKSSVTMAANGPSSYVANGGPVGGGKSGIQFGYDSPAISNITPQTGDVAPIPIPGGNARVPSPAHSPSPIPQPSASGGRPPSGLQQPAGQMTFGSLSSNDGDVSFTSFEAVILNVSSQTHAYSSLQRHMRQGSVPQNPNALGSQPGQPGAHFRRESGHSVHGDNPSGPGRGNFQPQGGRGRGGFPHNNNNNYNQQMGYPPGNQFRAGPGAGRGMPPAFQPQHQPRNMQYPNSPQAGRSPALVPSMPNTPNMPPANMQPSMSMSTPPNYHYPPPMGQHQQVRPPFLPPSERFPFKSSKKSKIRREQDRSLHAPRQVDSTHDVHGNEFSQRQRRYSKRTDQPWREPETNTMRVAPNSSAKMPFEPFPIVETPRNASHPVDLSPESGQFEYMLTFKHQNFGYPPQVDPYGRPMQPYAYNNMGYMAPPQTNSPGYNPNFAPPPYHQQSHNMSRTPSQPERPSSATQGNQPVVVSSTPQPQNAQLKSGTPSFAKPVRKSAAVLIKRPDGEVVDFKTLKTPASPAPSIQQSRTPPVTTSTPTPPPKSSTPAHSRTESQAIPKTAKEIQDELKEKIKQATQAAPAQAPAEDKAVKPVEKTAEVKVESKPEPKVEPKVEPTPVAKVEAASAAKPEPEKKPVETKAPEPAVKAAEPAAKAVEPTKEADKPVEPVKASDPEEDEMEKMIREMEEAEAEREKKEEEHRKKKEAEKAAAKLKEASTPAKTAAEADEALRAQEREMERLEDEKEAKRQQGQKTLSVAEALALAQSGKEAESSKVDSVTDKIAGLKIGDDKPSSPVESTSQKTTTADKRGAKPAALNLAPLNTKPVEPPQPSAALQSLKSARFLKVIDQDIYPEGISSPNPSLNAAVAKKGKTFKYDATFLLQFQKVFTEQPSLEFGQQVKSLIGDGDGGRSASSRAQTPSSGRQGSRTGSSGFVMGSFGAPPGRTIPPGTTSADRFAMASGSMSRPAVNPMASFQRPGGAFPTSSSMSRTSSQSNNMQNSQSGGRQGSRNTRGGGGSRRNDYNSKDSQAAKNMPLTANMDVKPIAKSANGWKPLSLTAGAQAAASTEGYLDPEKVQRKVKAALNKMTPEKFDKLADQILLIASQSKDESDGRTLRQVIQLTFEKATDEAHWASMYAKFCKRMLETMSAEVRDERIKDKNGNVVNGGNLFRKYLLNRCQEEFERGWQSILPEKEAEPDANKTLGEAKLMSDEYYVLAAAKRRGLGLVQFIGELYKLGMLTERIMHECVHKLVDYKGVPDEAEIESLSKLLRTIGGNLDATEKGRPMMDAYFARIQTMADLPELPSRMKFMLMDVFDLRRANWVSKEGNKGPKTLDEVRVEAEAAAALKAQENARSNQRGGGGGRPPAGRGDARHFSSGYQQQPSNQVGMDDLRRLKGSASRTQGANLTLGPTSMFSSRSNSGRRMGPGGSLGRAGEDSGASSRTGTPPTREGTSHSNAFSLLANMETDHPASPPSTSASLAASKAGEKKANEQMDGLSFGEGGTFGLGISFIIVFINHIKFSQHAPSVSRSLILRRISGLRAREIVAAAFIVVVWPGSHLYFRHRESGGRGKGGIDGEGRRSITSTRLEHAKHEGDAGRGRKTSRERQNGDSTGRTGLGSFLAGCLCNLVGSHDKTACGHALYCWLWALLRTTKRGAEEVAISKLGVDLAAIMGARSGVSVANGALGSGVWKRGERS
ncbi:hypothetical protein G7046_g3828 [Stylonectria norvegica]|nr:hypothetical protein G7046_g3828 [Stylonectria norvegica]